MNDKIKGSIYGMVSAISYGLNPLGGLRLGEEGVNTHTILFCRFSLAVVILAVFMAIKALKGNPSGIAYRLKQSFLPSHCATLRTPRGKGKASRITHSHWALIIVLGILFAMSAQMLYFAYLVMDSGIASTLLFVYPIMVAVIMAICFGERITVVTVTSLVLALTGIAMLNNGGGGGKGFNIAGCVMVMVSSLTYALYIVLLNRWRVKIPVLTLNLYVMAVCACCIAAQSFTAPEFHLMMLPTPRAVGYAFMLAIVPTIISLLTMTRAIELIGSTPTAIMGAFEPLTAVCVGIVVFHEAFTANIAIGNSLIIIAVVMIISNQYILQALKRFAHILPSRNNH